MYDLVYSTREITFSSPIGISENINTKNGKITVVKSTIIVDKVHNTDILFSINTNKKIKSSKEDTTTALKKCLHSIKY